MLDFAATITTIILSLSVMAITYSLFGLWGWAAAVGVIVAIELYKKVKKRHQPH